MTKAECDIIIVNWNSGQLLRECLESVVAYGQAAAKVVVVDNGSSDGSEAAAADIAGVHLVRAGANLGFATACNVGAAHCSSPFLLFLNPDARLLPGGLDSALTFMACAGAGDIGICGARLLNEAGETQRSCMNFPSLGTFVGQATGLDRLLPRCFTRLVADIDYEESRFVDQVIGAFFLIRTSLFRALDGFDERYFVYFEELDLSLRARQSGWNSYYLAEARAYHFGGGVSESVKAHRLFYLLRSRLLYGFKNFPRASAWGLVGVTLLVESLSRLIHAVGRLRWDEAGATLRAYGMLARAIPDIVRAARRRG